MTKTPNIEQVRAVQHVLRELAPISRKLNAIGVRGCNGRSDSQEKRDQTLENNLTQLAATLSESIGLRFYHQTDPGGLCVYLNDEKMEDNNYSNGICN